MSQASVRGASSIRRYGGWLAGGLLLFGWGFGLSAISGFNSFDESWFLQVVQRVASGEALYRDIFFGVTPLSVYATTTATSLFGVEVLALKAVVAACFALTALLTLRIARQLGLALGTALIVIAVQAVHAAPQAHPAYSPLAYLLLMACFSAALAWRDAVTANRQAENAQSRSTLTLALASAAAGLCFAAKQNVGLYTLAALTATVALTGRWSGRRWRALLPAVAIVCGAFILVAGLAMLPIVLDGGVAEFVDYGFANKETYLQVAAISYLDGVSLAVDSVLNAKALNDLAPLTWQVLYWLPLLALAGLAGVWLRADRGERGRATVVFLFAGIAFAGAYPRFDFAHFVYAIPSLLIGLAYAWGRMRPGMSRRWAFVVQFGLTAWLALSLALTLSGLFTRVTSGQVQVSTLPHFRGVVVEAERQARILADATALSDAARGEPLLILSPQAGLYYLVAAVKNPTPFDYPLVTAFGLTGEADTIAAISEGRIRAVCLAPLGASALGPARLERFVQENMQPEGSAGACRVYRSRP